MSQYSEMMGSFIRTGNYPMEANYIFPTEAALKEFYSDPINATTIQPDAISVGNAGAENWLISPQRCYIFIQRPRTATPENFAKTNGWATRYTGTISEFTGYLECSTVINTVSATAEEKNQITNLLKQGVYI